MIYGYARVSTQEQTITPQMNALNEFGCNQIFSDKVSGSQITREGLNKMKSKLKKGDKVIVWKLDRLARSMKDLIDLISWFENRGVAFESITEKIDTSNAGGKLIFHLFGALAEFEKELIKERTLAGLAAARKAGRCGGRPKSLSEEDKKKIDIMIEGGYSKSNIAKTFKISRSTLYRFLEEQ